MCVCRSLLLGHFDLDVDVVVSVAIATYAGNSFTTQTDLLVRLNPRRNLDKKQKQKNKQRCDTALYWLCVCMSLDAPGVCVCV